MGLADDIYDIGLKIEELDSAGVPVVLTYNQIQAGNDYSVVATLPNGLPARFSSLVASEVISFLNGILGEL